MEGLLATLQSPDLRSKFENRDPFECRDLSHFNITSRCFILLNGFIHKRQVDILVIIVPTLNGISVCRSFALGGFEKIKGADSDSSAASESDGILLNDASSGNEGHLVCSTRFNPVDSAFHWQCLRYHKCKRLHLVGPFQQLVQTQSHPHHYRTKHFGLYLILPMQIVP